MNKKRFQFGTLILLLSLISGCASYSITEQEMTDYLHDNVSFEQSVGIENLMYAQVSVTDLQVRIGRSDAERISVFASTNAKVQMFSSATQNVALDLEFSAIPEYDAQSGEVSLKSIRLEEFTEKGAQLDPDIKRLIKPAVSMIGHGLSQHPVYQLDTHVVQEALIKSAEPNLVIKDNKLVIELFD
ncbi:hypothetical protein A9264_05940 [Vibrio sp. UCD-FRSSP16_10]|uniref:DUF1439 domain-containing protein n=1 Tax=unclassified Vibrio TaxID=2614977 RepID=UPI0007FE275E|nr:MULTISPECIES: DUF1439 domain-containing protein [unclassified Vibrio]OBT08005.1 hypothetical protein A9260_08180 [Vibrio sp. UCD-FRSSP16_30]OBT17180.1 hypothetical protein A9264_05940 [Vibrio sp. UCD-FRSSP16_10]